MSQLEERDYPLDDDLWEWDYNVGDYVRRVFPTVAEIEAEVIKRFDATEACKSISYLLNSWVTGHRWGVYGGRLAKLSTYMQDRERQWDSDERERKRNEKLVEKGPWFSDPAKLAFNPRESMLKDDRKEHEGVSFARIWRDPLTRTIWLALKGRHLTSQYFRGAVVAQARWLRKHPPKSPWELNLHLGAGGSFLGPPMSFQEQAWPYVVSILIREKRWPYLTPGNLPGRGINYKYEPRNSVDK